MYTGNMQPRPSSSFNKRTFELLSVLSTARNTPVRTSLLVQMATGKERWLYLSPLWPRRTVTSQNLRWYRNRLHLEELLFAVFGFSLGGSDVR